MRTYRATLNRIVPLIAVFVLFAAFPNAYAQRPQRSPSNERSAREETRNDSGSSGQVRQSPTQRSESAPSQPRQETRQETRQEYRPQPRQESAPQPRQETRQETRQEYRPQPRQESSPQPRQETRQETRQEYAPQPRQESQPQPRQETRQETRQEYAPQPRQESQPQPRPQPRPEPRVERPATDLENRQSPPSERETRVQPRPDSNTRQNGTQTWTNTRSGQPTVPDRTRQTESRTVRPADPVPATRGASVPTNSWSSVLRKDYQDVGQIWRERTERRVKPTPAHSSRTNININFWFPGKYSYYAYDYRPGYAYPSLYCYYYGLFPPYIYSHRVYYVHRPAVRYVYVELPIHIVYRSYDHGTYYLEDYRYRTLSTALRDIRRAWEYGDPDLLMSHVAGNARIDVFLRDDYAYSLDKDDYFDMTYDAMTNLSTVEFEFYRVRQRNNNEAVAYGKHVYYDDDYDDGLYKRDGKRKMVYVSYTLKRNGSLWYVTEVGSSPSKY